MHPRALAPLMRGDLDWIVMRSLEKELERRFQTVGEVKTKVETAASMSAGVAAAPAAKPQRSTPGEIAGVAKMTLWVTGLVLLAPVLLGMGILRLILFWSRSTFVELGM